MRTLWGSTLRSSVPSADSDQQAVSSAQAPHTASRALSKRLTWVPGHPKPPNPLSPVSKLTARLRDGVTCPHLFKLLFIVILHLAHRYYCVYYCVAVASI